MNPSNHIDLEVGPSAHLPRRLKISWRPMTRIVVTMYGIHGSQMLAFATSDFHERSRLYLERTSLGPTLWVDCAAFDLSEHEFEQVHATFGPHGLQIHSDSPCADHSTVPSAKQAAETVAPPCDGLSGESPSSDCASTGGGALDPLRRVPC